MIGMKIAVIGGGISGLSTAWLLSKNHEVTLFEKEKRLGGHSNTISIRKGGKRYWFDTGFMVFNRKTYPNLVPFFEALKVPSMPTDMSFSVSHDDGAFEYSSAIPNGIFADRANILRISFYDFLLEIQRFNKAARAALVNGLPETVTLTQFLKKHRFSKELEEKYLLPMIGAIWTTPKKLARQFPANALFSFLANHQLLQARGHVGWSTIPGGSRIYVERVARDIIKHGGTIVKNAQIKHVRRTTDAAFVRRKGRWEPFDYVVFATHPDEALALLADVTHSERAVLSKFAYEKNDIYVHSDVSLMPKREAAWASFNYLGRSEKRTAPQKVCLTYWMNIVQSIKAPFPILITFNPFKKPKKSLTYRRLMYSHPLYTLSAQNAKKQLVTLQGKKRTLFCGAYFGYGFHEDGIASAVAVARYFGIAPPWKKKKRRP